MRLNEWRMAAAAREAMSSGVLAVVGPVPAALGADADPYCRVNWGEAPAVRYSVFGPEVPQLPAPTSHDIGCSGR